LSRSRRNGPQYIRRSATQIIKKQGNGGILNLATGERFPLQLVAPHSVRKVENHYWVFDSGKAAINIYSDDWQLVSMLPTSGYGRGAELSTSSGIYYAGISPIRKRYLGVFPGQKEGPSQIELFDVERKLAIGTLTLSYVEQVNNVYLLSEIQVEHLAGLPLEQSLASQV
jgi:hypothetical protein